MSVEQTVKKQMVDNLLDEKDKSNKPRPGPAPSVEKGRSLREAMKAPKGAGLDYTRHSPKDSDLTTIPPFLRRSVVEQVEKPAWELGDRHKDHVAVREARLFKIADELNKYVGDVLEGGDIIWSREVALEMREHFFALLGRCYVPVNEGKTAYLPIKVVRK